MAARPWVPKFLNQLLNNAQDIGDEIAAASEKATPIGADSLGLSDSEDGNILKKWTISNLQTFLITAFDFLYQPLSTALSKITESGGLPFWDGAPWPGGGGGGFETLISSTTIVTADIVGSFGFALDKTKSYRMIIEPCNVSASSYRLNFEASEDGGLNYVTGVVESAANVYGSTSTSQSIVNKHLADFGVIGQLLGEAGKVDLTLFYSAPSWSMLFTSGGASALNTAYHVDGSGGIYDLSESINFINFFLDAGIFDNAVINWYEVNYG